MALLSDRQLKAFKKHKIGVYSGYFVILLVLIAACAELLSNSKPIILIFKEKVYFPVYENVSNKDLDIEGIYLQVDFRRLQSEMPGKVTMVWPPIRWDPFESDMNQARFPSGPDGQHLMGTDNRGRDIASRLIYGLRNSLIFAVIVWVLSYVLGILVGSVQGYMGGRVDFFFQRIVEILSAIPLLFVLIILASFGFGGVYWLALFLTLFGGWIGISYYMRASFFRLRKLEFVEAAGSMGASTPRLFFKHLLPNSMTPVITLSPFTITSNIGSLAALDFLGFGLAPPSASWGELLNQAVSYFDHAWWLAVYPALALALTLMAINFVGEALREALDPRSGD